MVTKNIKLATLVNYLDTYLESAKLEEKAYNGIQVANDGQVTALATAVSASLETIEKAIDLKVQALIVHHGIFCKNDPHPLVGITYKKVKKLMEHTIALLCYHLPLDAHQKVGNNWKAAYDLGLTNLKPFAYYGTTPIGVIGSVKEISFDEFKKQVEHYYGRTAHIVKVKDPISSIAILSGGGEKFIVDAAHAGADCLITGRIDEPVWDHAHEQNISFLGLGHYGTETVGPKALAEHLHEQFDIPCTFIKTENPF